MVALLRSKGENKRVISENFVDGPCWVHPLAGLHHVSKPPASFAAAMMRES